jgi:SnoaL-like polyketide cyclase
MTVARVAAGQNEVALEWRMSANFTGGSFQGIEPTGRPVELRGVDIIEIADGKIVSNTAYYDGMSFARGAGLLPAQDSGAERAMRGAVNAATRLRRAVSDGREALVERRDAFSQRRSAA